MFAYQKLLYDQNDPNYDDSVKSENPPFCIFSKEWETRKIKWHTILYGRRHLFHFSTKIHITIHNACVHDVAEYVVQFLDEKIGATCALSFTRSQSKETELWGSSGNQF